MLLRLHQARGAERQQLKWFVYAASLAVAGFVVAPVAPLPDPWPYLPLMLALLFLPVAMGIAVLRYRLYDIDRLINRTLVYGLLTAVLGGVYAGLVLVLGQLFGRIGDRPPSWAVAGSTLAVAALFQPARRRIQRAVDRRFNRRRHDGARSIEAFNARLREHVDLDTLTGQLLAVVEDTMQPTQLSLWLRPHDSSDRLLPERSRR